MELFPPDPPPSDGEVALRPWTEADVPTIVAACRDPEIPRWTQVPSPYDEGDARAFVMQAQKDWAEGARAQFAIVDARSGAVLGSIGLVGVDWPVGEVGYWVAREARRRGVATRATRLLARWALLERGFARLQLVADPENTGSLRVAECAGFQREGVLRAGLENKGRRTNCVMFSLLPGDLA